MPLDRHHLDERSGMKSSHCTGFPCQPRLLRTLRRLLASSLALGDDESRLAPSERTGCRRFTYGADRLLNFLSSGGIGAVAESVNGYLIDTFVFLTWLSPLGLDGTKLLLTCVPVGYMLPAVTHLVPELTGKRRKRPPGGTDVVPVPTTISHLCFLIISFLNVFSVERISLR